MSKYFKSESLIQLNLKDVIPNYDQPRNTFNEKALSELAQSVRVHGVLEPILVVRAEAGGFYKIIAGERRFRAASLVGLTKIPAIIISGSDEELREIAIIENSQRQQLNPIEEAEAVQKLIEKAQMTQEQAAVALSRSRSAIANLLRLLTLPADVQALVKEGKLSQGHARILLSIKDDGVLSDMAKKCIENKWSVRALTDEIEKLARQNQKRIKEQQERRSVSAELKEMVTDMERVFQTPIILKGDDNKGKFIIEYESLDQLNRILDIIKYLRKQPK